MTEIEELLDKAHKELAKAKEEFDATVDRVHTDLSNYILRGGSSNGTTDRRRDATDI